MNALLWLWTLCGVLPAHDFHLSKAVVEYNSRDQALQVTLHIFLDDLELALRERGAGEELFLCTEKEHPEADGYLDRYLAKTFRLWVDGRPVAAQYLGKEISDDLMAAWCYLEVKEVPLPRQLTIDNRILMQVYDDQKNIVSIRHDGQAVDYFLVVRGDTRRQALF